MHKRYFLVDPVFLHGVTRSELSRWSELGLADVRSVARRAAMHGLKFGAIVSNAPRMSPSMLSVARTDRELTDDEMSRLKMLFGKIVSTPFEGPVLSQKQIEVLVRISHGKSEREVSEELGISLATVKLRLVSARRKNDCSTTSQLVALAAKGGLL